MKKISKNNPYKFFICRMLAVELVGNTLLATLGYILLKEHFLYSLRKIIFAISVMVISWVGAEIIAALFNNRWRVVDANNEYPIYKALFLIFVNTMAVLLTRPDERIDYIIFFLLFFWIILLFIFIIRRRFMS